MNCWPKSSAKRLRAGEEVPVLGPAIARARHVLAGRERADLGLEGGESRVPVIALAVSAGLPLAFDVLVPEVKNHVRTVADSRFGQGVAETHSAPISSWWGVLRGSRSRRARFTPTESSSARSPAASWRWARCG